MKTVCTANQCTGCGACIDACKKGAIRFVDNLESYNAVIDEKQCIDCGACKKVCPNLNDVVYLPPIEWHQGWVNDSEYRQKSASGGLAAAIERAFILSGGVVYSCTFCDGEFSFVKTTKVDEVEKYLGSKYVKSNPTGCYKEIKNLLLHDQKVLFVGLPCHVAAVKIFVGNALSSKLYTIDLICHGTPSPKLLDLFLSQYGQSLQSITDIHFRNKGKFHVGCKEETIGVSGTTDAYTTAFLGAISYTENCYHCKYAKFERVSDITLGDSWGSKEPRDEIRKGVSLVLCQSDKGKELLSKADVYLKTVDIGVAIENNNQLNEPSRANSNRASFFKCIKRGKAFNLVVWRFFPKERTKQFIKAVLIKMHIFLGGGV